MTKKSFARMQRDAAKKDLEQNTCWSDLEGVYASTRLLLAQHAHLAAFGKRHDLIALLPDTRTVIDNISILVRDLNQMNQELDQLHQLHAGKTGGSMDPDEVLHSIGLFEQYTLFMEKHEAVIMPIAAYIADEFAKAEAKLLQMQQNDNHQRQVETCGTTDIVDAEIIEAQPAATTQPVEIVQQVQTLH